MPLKALLSSTIIVFFSFSAAQAQPEDCSAFLSRPASYSSRMEQLFSGDQAESLLKELVELRQSGRIRRAPQLFEAFVFYRLRLLPAPVSKEVMMALRQDFRLRYEPNERARLGGGAMLFESKEDGKKSCTVLVCLPEALEDTALDYAVRVHEIEHVIQHFVNLRPQGAWQIFMAEQGAMRAEAVMLGAFSEEELKELKNLVSRSLFEPSALDFSLRALDMILQGKRVQDYVEGQWRAGRYPPPSSSNDQ